MTKSRLLFLCLSFVIVVPILAGSILAATTRDEPGRDSFEQYYAVFDATAGRVKNDYVDPTQEKELLSQALDGVTEALDPFSAYIPAEAGPAGAQARDRAVRRSGLLLLKENGILYVAGIAPGSAAAGSEVRLGDVIAEIAGQPTRVMPIWKAHELLAADGKSSLNLKAVRLGEMKSVTVPLTAPVDPAPALREEQGVGVLRVVSLEPAALTQLEKLVEEANTRHYSRLVIDLRGVLTGDPEAAYKTAGLFVRGELGSLVRRGNKVETFTSSKEPRWQGRVVVLINHSTLGAAEVLAAVLKQKAAAQLVGQRSFGFAGHQTLAPLSAGGQLLYTDGFYTGPDGEPLRKGLTPDSRVEELPLEPVSEGTEPPSPSDTVLKKGLEVVLGDAGATASKASESKVAS